MKRRLISLLIRLTDVPKAPTPDAKTEEFLANAWDHQPFRSYLSGRERKLMEYLSRGGSGLPVNRDNYLLAYGQLQELTNLVNLAKACNENRKQVLLQSRSILKSNEGNAAREKTAF